MCSIQITRIYPIQTVITPWMPVAKILVVGSNFSAAMFKQKSWPRYKKRHDSSIAKMLSCETCLRIWLFKTVCKTFLKKKHEFEKPCFWSKHCFFDKEPTFSPVFGCLFRWDVLSISQSICGNFQRNCQERLSYSWIPWAFQAGFIRFSGQPCSGPLWDVHSCGGFYDHVMWLGFCQWIIPLIGYLVGALEHDFYFSIYW